MMANFSVDSTIYGAFMNYLNLLLVLTLYVTVAVKTSTFMLL